MRRHIVSRYNSPLVPICPAKNEAPCPAAVRCCVPSLCILPHSLFYLLSFSSSRQLLSTVFPLFLPIIPAFFRANQPVWTLLSGLFPENAAPIARASPLYVLCLALSRICLAKSYLEILFACCACCDTINFIEPCLR